MKIRLCVIIISLFFVVLPNAMATSDGPDYYDVKGVKSGDILNIRSKPNMNGKIVGEIPYNAKEIENMGEFYPEFAPDRGVPKGTIVWCKIKYKKKVGWVACQYLEEGCSPGESCDFAKEGSIQRFIGDLIATSQKVEEQRDLIAIQPLVDKDLFQWIKPGIMLQLSKRHKKGELRGFAWLYPEKDSTIIETWFEKYAGVYIVSRPTQGSHTLIFTAFQNIKEGPIVLLPKMKFEPDVSEGCEKAEKWTEKWLVYPGDYLFDQIVEYSDPEGFKKSELGSEYLKNKAQKTLLYFEKGEGAGNHYFGIVQSEDRWLLRYIGYDEDCNI